MQYAVHTQAYISHGPWENPGGRLIDFMYPFYMVFISLFLFFDVPNFG